MQGWEFWSVAILAALLVGIAKGGWSSVGMLCVPVLSLQMNPLSSAGLLLPIILVSDVFGFWIYRHSFSRRLLAILIPAGLVGVALGWTLVPWINDGLPGGDRAIIALVGLIGTVFAVRELTHRDIPAAPRKPKVYPGLAWGALAGFTSYICHSGAPPYQAYVQPLGLDRQTFAGTTTILFAVVNLAKITPYLMTGQLDRGSIHTSVYLMIPALVGVWLGKFTVGRVTHITFYGIVTWTLLAVSLSLVGKALFPLAL